MDLAKLLVTAGGAFLVIFIYWFFFGKKEKESESTLVVVNGGYKPSTIKVKAAVSTKLTFLRTDENSCLEEIIFPDLKIREYLPLNKKTEIEINPPKSGTYDFHCGMNMYKGKVITS